MFFDRAMLAMGNVRPQSFPSPSPNFSHPQLTSPFSHPQILFLLGLTLIIGPSKTFLFFARRSKIPGTAAFCAGILLILLRWPLVGFLVELYGIFVLFGDFLGTIGGVVRGVPIIGPVVGGALEALGRVGRGWGVFGGAANRDLPV
jgi:hypothetical protein